MAQHVQIARWFAEPLMLDLGITACREGISWVRCELRPGRYDFARCGDDSVKPMARSTCSRI